jgi:hypothetical protein
MDGVHQGLPVFRQNLDAAMLQDPADHMGID